ncbi:hypothetical protein IC615_24955 [Serratia ureilytica]
MGRLDHQIKIHGQRIELEEIDAVLNRHPQVLQSCANMHDGRIVAYVVASGAEADEKALLALCREYLPAYMLPQCLVFLSNCRSAAMANWIEKRCPLRKARNHRAVAFPPP